jgi:hypothetical protein
VFCETRLEKNGNKVRLSKLGEARDGRLMKGFRESGCRIEEVCFGLWLAFWKKRSRRRNKGEGWVWLLPISR